jgi:hypothetical protein
MSLEEKIADWLHAQFWDEYHDREEAIEHAKEIMKLINKYCPYCEGECKYPDDEE